MRTSCSDLPAGSKFLNGHTEEDVGCREMVQRLQEVPRMLLLKSEAFGADLPTDAVTIENLTMTSVFLPMLEKTSANVRSVMSSVTCIAAIEHC